MHSVAGFARDHPSDDLPAEKRQIADQIENFMTDELILVTEAGRSPRLRE